MRYVKYFNHIKRHIWITKTVLKGNIEWGWAAGIQWQKWEDSTNIWMNSRLSECTTHTRDGGTADFQSVQPRQGRECWRFTAADLHCGNGSSLINVMYFGVILFFLFSYSEKKVLKIKKKSSELQLRVIKWYSTCALNFIKQKHGHWISNVRITFEVLKCNQTKK